MIAYPINESNHSCPVISIIIPCRNEEGFIAQCLDSILNATYPFDLLEIIVIDGKSEDDTGRIIEKYTERYSKIRLVDNVRRTTPAALNIGLSHARGSVIIRMDAHAVYPRNYISGLVAWLDKSGADNVGGLCVTLPGDTTWMAQAIALALAHPFGVGNAYFRIGFKSPRWVDTVPFGCYRREVFDRIGWFDEELERNQDDEFNNRLIMHGGKILLVPDVVSYYYARDSLRKLWIMYYQYGYYKPKVIHKVGGVMTLRQTIPPLFIMGISLCGAMAPWSKLMRQGLISVLLVYINMDILCSVSAGLRKGTKCSIALCLVFPTLHFSYGLGFMMGFLHSLFRKKERNRPLINRFS